MRWLLRVRQRLVCQIASRDALSRFVQPHLHLNVRVSHCVKLFRVLKCFVQPRCVWWRHLLSLRVLLLSRDPPLHYVVWCSPQMYWGLRGMPHVQMLHCLNVG